MKVLLLEYNSAVTETLALALSKNYQLKTSSTGQFGLKLADEFKPEIIILDLNLPDISGLEACKEIRKIGAKTPILVLSGDNSLSTKLELFAAGADDYLVKPFSLGELKARLNVIRKRTENYKTALSGFKAPALILDKPSMSVIRDGGEAIILRRKEYAILEYLIKYAGETVSRSHLASYAWDNKNEPWSNTVNVHIKHLRDKIDKPYSKQLITTIHGYGYRLESI